MDKDYTQLQVSESLRDLCKEKDKRIEELREELFQTTADLETAQTQLDAVRALQPIMLLMDAGLLGLNEVEAVTYKELQQVLTMPQEQFGDVEKIMPQALGENNETL